MKRILSLFDGISGARVALDRAGIQYDRYYASEIDKYAIQIAIKNYPDTIQLGNVTSVAPSSIDGDVWLLIGGSPCQGFSNAGAGLNFDDPRSKLFFEYVRLLKELKPKWFILENVKMKKEWADIISEYLGVGPVLINSALVSAQNRERYYWTNIPNIIIPEDKNLFWDSVYCNNSVGTFIYTQQSFSWIFKTPKRAKKFKRYYSHEKVKMQMLEASHYKGYSNQRCFSVYDNILGDRYISPLECERLQTYPDEYTDGVSNTQRYKVLGNSFTVDVIAHLYSFIPDK